MLVQNKLGDGSAEEDLGSYSASLVESIIPCQAVTQNTSTHWVHKKQHALQEKLRQPGEILCPFSMLGFTEDEPGEQQV